MLHLLGDVAAGLQFPADTKQKNFDLFIKVKLSLSVPPQRQLRPLLRMLPAVCYASGLVQLTQRCRHVTSGHGSAAVSGLRMRQ